jgi:flagellar biosynthesis anti-sigma factor FlgM
MRIGPEIPDLQGTSTDRATSSSRAGQATRAASPAESDASPDEMDTVSISSLTTSALQTPAVRQDMVASLQQSYASGQYRLDPNGIAAAMLGEA